MRHMKTMFAISLVLATILSLAMPTETPKLTDSQKLTIRNAQVEVLSLSSQMQALQNQWQELNQRSQAARQRVTDAIKAATPEGYDIQEQNGDLVLVAKPKPPEKAPEVKK